MHAHGMAARTGGGVRTLQGEWCANHGLHVEGLHRNVYCQTYADVQEIRL